MSLDYQIFLFLLIPLGFMTISGIVREVNRRKFEPTASQDHVFRCTTCSFVYTDDPDVDRSRCPQCGLANDVYNF